VTWVWIKERFVMSKPDVLNLEIKGGGNFGEGCGARQGDQRKGDGEGGL
jgi:hypothetical protein